MAEKTIPARVGRAPRARRYPFVASVDLTDLESEVTLQERVTDLSLYGCRVVARVAAQKAFPAGTRVRIRITHGGVFAAIAMVAYSWGDDLGIIFTQVEPNDQAILEKWIRESASRRETNPSTRT